MNKQQPVPRPQSIAEILDISRADLDTIEDPYYFEDGTTVFLGRSGRVSQEFTETASGRKVSVQVKKRMDRGNLAKNITVAANKRKLVRNNLFKSPEEDQQVASLGGLNLSPEVGVYDLRHDTIYINKKTNEQ